MSKKDKLLQKAIDNPNDLSFLDFITLLEHLSGFLNAKKAVIKYGIPNKGIGW